jgi:hypothetical protein
MSTPGFGARTASIPPELRSRDVDARSSEELGVGRVVGRVRKPGVLF